MAKLSFVRGAATGKMGEFVGAKWKGINYIRLWAKPTNPRTEGQISIRLVFKALSLFATALFNNGLLGLIPPARRMTERNSVFKANKHMLTDKTFTPATLQVSKPNTTSRVIDMSATVTSNMLNLSAKFLELDEIVEGDAYIVIYDAVKGLILSVFKDELENGVSIYQNGTPLPDGFGTPEGSQKEDCRAYFFAAGLDADGKKVISSTYSVALS